MKISKKQSENLQSYCTDKFHGLPSVVCHNYGEFYDKLFDGLENKSMSILEIGIYNGGSVRLFHDYLTKAKIVGVDISNYWNYGKIEDYNRLSIYYFNAYNLENLSLLPEQKYDVIIDDGPHTASSQIIFLSNFSKFLNPGGKLILEDVQNFNLNEILDKITCDKSKIKVHRWDKMTNVSDDIIIEYEN